MSALTTAAIGLAAPRCCATGVPIDGFLPMVGISLTDEFDDGLASFFPAPATSYGGTPLSPTGSARYDVALLDTGAATSLITASADAYFNLDGPYSGEPDGFRGTELLPIGGATGQSLPRVSDPLGLYAAGLQTRMAAGAPLSLDPDALVGQTNTSLATWPADSELPSILGLSFASQYATRIRNSQPQVFELDGRTVRSPAVDFLELGTGSQHGISRKAPMDVSGASPSTPLYQLNFATVINGDDSWENPSTSTVVQGGHFLNVNVSNDNATLSAEKFFFDTGASVTVLSELTALQLGIDVQLDAPEFTISILGSGGTSGAIPGYYVDEFTVLATGGAVTLTNVPVLVFDVTNPADPGNIVPGIVGTNAFAGRDIVIDPVPSLGGGGASAGLYISDPVTTDHNWTSPLAVDAWGSAGNWSAAASPTLLGVANVHHAAGGHQQAVVSGSAVAWEVNTAGAHAGATMSLRIAFGADLTVFSGVHVEHHGALQLEGGVLDAQYIAIDPQARLTGVGSIRTGSGPIAGQVENSGGVVAPGLNGVGTLEIEGRFASTAAATLEYTLGGLVTGVDHGTLLIDGPAAWGGLLSVDFQPWYLPSAGDSFVLAEYDTTSGSFDGLDLPSSFHWEVEYGSTELRLTVLSAAMPGDFDGNGMVDAADLATWQAGFGPGGYDGADFLTWQRNFGAGVGGVASVPEPAAGALALVAGAWSLRRRRSGKA